MDSTFRKAAILLTTAPPAPHHHHRRPLPDDLRDALKQIHHPERAPI